MKRMKRRGKRTGKGRRALENRENRGNRGNRRNREKSEKSELTFISDGHVKYHAGATTSGLATPTYGKQPGYAKRRKARKIRRKK